MLHHPGEVLAVFRPGDKDVKSGDKDTLATVRMWDENVMTLVVDPAIASDLKAGDKVFVDYRPHNISSTDKPAIVQKQLVAKIIRGPRAETIWKEYRKWHGGQKQLTTHQPVSDYMG